jgi:hypothetical protein
MQIRKRLTYANVMSSIAIFLVLGGAAFAATKLPKNSVGTKQIKKNAVTTAKIKKNAVTAAKIKAGAVSTAQLGNGAVSTDKIADGAVTGAKVNLSSLGKVPSAANADHANTATALASPNVLPFKFFVNGTQTATILAVQGAVFEGSCAAGTLSDSTQIKGTADNGIAKVAGVTEGQVAFNNSQDSLKTGETVSLVDKAVSNEVGATADYMGAGGNPNVSVVYATESNQPPGIGAECLVWGTAQTP